MANQTAALIQATSPTADEVEALVIGRLNGRIRAFHLILESQGLVLRGQCRTFHAKQVAQHLVMEFSTVPILANEIEVANGDER